MVVYGAIQQVRCTKNTLSHGCHFRHRIGKEAIDMRCIDADTLKKSVLDLHDCYNGFSDTYDKACIIGVIDEEPTIEPEHKTGEWIWDEN